MNMTVYILSSDGSPLDASALRPQEPDAPPREVGNSPEVDSAIYFSGSGLMLIRVSVHWCVSGNMAKSRNMIKCPVEIMFDAYHEKLLVRTSVYEISTSDMAWVDEGNKGALPLSAPLPC